MRPGLAQERSLLCVYACVKTDKVIDRNALLERGWERNLAPCHLTSLTTQHIVTIFQKKITITTQGSLRQN